MYAVQAHKKIRAEDCVKYFCKTGLFPFNRSFADRFRVPTVDLDLGEEAVEQERPPSSLEQTTAAQARRIAGTEGDDLPDAAAACNTASKLSNYK